MLDLNLIDQLNDAICKVHAMLVMINEHFSKPRNKNISVDYYELTRNLGEYDTCLSIAFEELNNIKKIVEEVENDVTTSK